MCHQQPVLYDETGTTDIAASNSALFACCRELNELNAKLQHEDVATDVHQEYAQGGDETDADDECSQRIGALA